MVLDTLVDRIKLSLRWGQSGEHKYILIYFFVGVYGPSLSALVTTLIFEGQKGLIKLVGRRAEGLGGLPLVCGEGGVHVWVDEFGEGRKGDGHDLFLWVCGCVWVWVCGCV